MKQSEFILRSKIKHDDKYDYSLVEYIRNSDRVRIICKRHGDFLQIPKGHMDGQGCRKCFNESLFLTTEIFIQRANSIHSFLYNYDNVVYVKNNIKVKIVCKGHGEFMQSPNHHLNIKQGCPKCKFEKSRLDLSEFIEKSKEKHEDIYDYSKIEEFTFNKKVNIVCKTHGIFMQLPNNHCNLGYGCYMCKDSIGEKIISNILDSLNIEYIRERRFDGCKNKNHLPFDFYLPNFNICIEYQGEQHFTPIEYFGGEKRFKEQLINDNIKKEWCEKNNIELIIVGYLDDISLKMSDIFKNH